MSESMQRSALGVVVLSLLISVVFIQISCSVRFPANPVRDSSTIQPSAIHQYAWPTRQPQALHAWADASGIATIHGTRPATVFPDPDRARRLLQSDAPIVLPVCRGIYGQGVVFQESLLSEHQSPLYYRVLINDLGPDVLAKTVAGRVPWMVAMPEASAHA